MTSTAAARPASPSAAWNVRTARVAVPLFAIGAFASGMSAGFALVAGVGFALTLGNPWPRETRPLAQRLLMASVVGLGAGMNLDLVTRVGLHGLAYTALGIGCALGVGTALGRRLGVSRDTSLLISVGTAICGGSAIAAVAPVLRAKDHDVSMALVTVFLLNGVALFLFPAIGHRLHLSQDSFGLWCALAIHDTSSVVGAAAQYGERALDVATAAKLARALWIVPVTFFVATLRARTGRAEPRARPPWPWFVAGFLGVAALVTYVPVLHETGRLAAELAHRGLSVTLFLIGLGLSQSALRELGPRPMLQAVALWAVMAGGSLAGIACGWVR
jgi:uncharacterized integral membrane protein (TIGR00698 family)